MQKTKKLHLRKIEMRSGNHIKKRKKRISAMVN